MTRVPRGFHGPTMLAMGVVIVVCAVAAGGLFAVFLGRSPAVGPGESPSSAGGGVVTAPPTGSVGFAAVATPVGSGAASGLAVGSASVRPSAQASGLVAVVDRTLLRVLPATIGSLPVKEFPEAETQAVTDPDLARNVTRVATAFVGDAAGANWAYTSVVDVRPEAQSDAFYRDWQESFDRSACEQAGGVTGHTTITIAGRTVERTACGSGVRTYHVRLARTNLLISVSDLGDANLGEAELANLRP